MVVLRGRLSNPDFKDLLQSLISRKVRKVPARRRQAVIKDAAGRRLFGSVGSAVVAVLAASGGEMRVRNVHAAVETVLAGPVSFYSVADFLARRSRGTKPLFVRTRHGHYALLR